ncbi:hypothetical protein CP02DC14_0414A, partial [Chlamydia psittaci 02DC14]
MFFCF